MRLAFDITPAFAQQSSAPELTSAMIRGSSVYQPAELFHLYRDHLGKPISRENLSAIVTALADQYQAAGYPRPRVTVDDELMRLGILRINVFEARIDEVAISGDPGPHRSSLERMAADLETGEALRQQTLQDALRRARRLPGLSLSASTSQSAETPNLYRLEVDADYKPISGSVRLTNRGTEDVGPHIAVGQVLANGLAGGRLNAGATFGAAVDYDEFRGLGLVGSVLLGDEGASLAINTFRTRASPRDAPGQIIDRYLRDQSAIRYTRPILGGTATRLVTSLEATDLAIEHAGLVFRDERLRMLSVGVAHNFRRGAVEHAGSVDLVKGLGGLGSGLTALDVAMDRRREDFSLLRLSWIRLARLTPKWSWRLDTFAQQTAYTLPYTERFRFGGERLGRGFEVASVAGDSGLGAKVELRRDLTGAPPVLGRASLYGFYDLGAVWRNDRPGRESAATAGFGFAINAERVRSSIELAKPLTYPDVEGTNEPQVFFEVRMSL